MSSTEICTRHPVIGLDEGSKLPLDLSRIQDNNSGNDSLLPRPPLSESATDINASGSAAISPAIPGEPATQFPPRRTTQAYHQRSDSGSSTEEGLARDADYRIESGKGGGYNDTVGDAERGLGPFNESDAVLLISPIISRTQSASIYDQRRSGSVTGEGYETVTLDKDHHVPSRVIEHANTAPPDLTRKDQKLGVLSATAHRFSTFPTISSLTSWSTSVKPQPSEGGSGTSTPRAAGKRASMFPFTLPSFHLPQMPSAPSFLTEITTRKRSKSSGLGTPPLKLASQSAKSSPPDKPSASKDIDQNESIQPSPLRRSTSHPSLLSDTSSFDGRFASVQSMKNARIKAIKDNFRGLSPGNTIANAANALSTYANSINSALSSSLPIPTSDSTSNPAGLPPLLPHPLETVEGDVVVMGGYRGSILREASGQKRRVWIPLRVGLNLRKVNLEIGLNDEDEEAMAQKIIPDGMLTHIGPVDIGRRLLRKLRTGQCAPGANSKKFGRAAYEYSYDWRLSPHILSRQLIAFLETLPCNQDNGAGQPRKAGRGALVIAHSLGGLIVRHAVNQRPELFSAVLFAGTPQSCVNILGPLRNGDTVMLSSRVLTAQVNFTMRSSYALLPVDGRCFVDKKTGEAIPVDFFDVNTWINYALSPCVAPAKACQTQPGEAMSDVARETTNAINRDRTISPHMDPTPSTLNPFSQISPFSDGPTCTLPISETIPYLERTLKAVKEFKAQLEFKPEIGYPDIEERKITRHDVCVDKSSVDAITAAGSIGAAPTPGVDQARKSVYYPPMAILYSNSTPTVKGAKVDGAESIHLDNVYDDLIFGSGMFIPLFLFKPHPCLIIMGFR